MRTNPKLLSILGYLLILTVGAGSRFINPEEIKASEQWNLFTTLPPISSESQETVLGAQDLYSGSTVLPIQGDMVLAPVNKFNALPSSYVPSGLTAISGVPGSSGEYLRGSILPYFYQLIGAAKQAGFNLSVVSAYRSYQTQVATFNYWVAQYGYAVATTGSALPGHSEHQLGTTVDLGLVGDPDFTAFTAHPVAEWVAKNSYKFGFVVSYPKGKQAITGYIWEPWHVRWVGVELATKLYQSGLTLEEYLQRL
ncbi:MAG: M15 family metallopeptidase [Patescibacteria group bacterium]